MRQEVVDLARGMAIVQMVAYHFCYDLNYFSWIRVALTEEPGWVGWRTAIVAQFLFLAGVSLALREDQGAVPRGPAARRFWRRWGQIAGCALCVSLASAQLFGPRWIWFGVLHFVALAQLLLLPVQRLRATNLALGALVLALGIGVQLPWFAPASLSWIGFSPVKPHTEDFVPLVPWLGVVLLGMGTARLWQGSAAPWAQGLRSLRARAPFAPLGLLGRWPLTVYMLHQPVLFALLYAVRAGQRALGHF